MTSVSKPMNRRTIDISGRLGSFYNAAYDKVIQQHPIQPSKTKQPKIQHICKVFSGDKSTDLINYLKQMDYNDPILQSIRFGMIELSGISSFINHNQPIDENTRFLYYSYKSKEEKLNITTEIAEQIVSISPIPPRATHIITKIIWGIEILCVIPISEQQSSETINKLLENISKRLLNGDNDFVLAEEEETEIEKLTNVYVYGSKTCIDGPNSSLLSVFKQLQHWKKHENFHHPLKYEMNSLRWIYNNKQFSEIVNPTEQINSILTNAQSTLVQIDKSVKDVERLFNKIPENFSNPKLDQQCTEFQKKFVDLLDNYEKCRENLRTTLADVRRNLSHYQTVDQIISNHQYSSLNSEFRTLFKDVHRILSKDALIEQLKNDQIEYRKVSDVLSYGHSLTTFQDIDAAIRSSLINKDASVVLLYSNDQLIQKNEEKWKQIYQELLKEKQKSLERTSCIYIDFNQYPLKLADFTIIRLPIESISSSEPNHSNEPAISSASNSRQTTHSVREINVLLLGETGVGKSTFINAFVNYLTFETLQQAEQNDPIALIPVSFLMTIGDQFEEVTVKFGDDDQNENHQNQGQSVTQQCKSYVFHLNDKIQFRLIDTPGFGDTRGITQDDINTDHILTYINNLSHLNAICLLFKPNNSKLNVFFRSCIQQLLNYLTPVCFNNIIICFTNTRSTFFAPGDTGPLLQEMLKQEQFKGIQFEKRNTFCFDSEAFRYLMARRCKIEIDDYLTQEFVKSWETSMNESVRLLNYIQTLEPYNFNEWETPRKAVLEISMLARPLMESLRLIIYNGKLYESGSNEKEMRMKANPVSIRICSKCAQNEIVKLESFYIIKYETVKSQESLNCQCLTKERHYLIEFTIQYEFVSQQLDAFKDELTVFYHEFLYKCDRLVHNLRQKGLLYENDPFQTILERFIDEEKYICQEYKNDSMINTQMEETLHSLIKLREENKQTLLKLNEQLSINEVFKIIFELKSIAIINEQIECLNRSRQLMMEKNEYAVKLPSIKNKTFTEQTNIVS